MEVVKETKEYKIYKKRSGRFCVADSKKKWINGEKKTEILVAAGLVKQMKKKEAPAEPAQ
jgi:hypothetical protein